MTDNPRFSIRRWAQAALAAALVVYGIVGFPTPSNLESQQAAAQNRCFIFCQSSTNTVTNPDGTTTTHTYDANTGTLTSQTGTTTTSTTSTSTSTTTESTAPDGTTTSTTTTTSYDSGGSPTTTTSSRPTTTTNTGYGNSNSQQGGNQQDSSSSSDPALREDIRQSFLDRDGERKRRSGTVRQALTR